MRIPLTRYGLPQAAVIPALTIAIMAGTAPGLFGPCRAAFAVIELVLFVILCWVLAFFRDPERKVPEDGELLLAPADGVITDISELEESPLNVPAIRIGIFLSIFDVHINRMPCAAKVEKTEYRKGQFKNALDPESSKVNEANDVFIKRTDSPHDPLLVRQISGAIARRIVCEAGAGAKFSAGQRFGMIKFGSRTELYIPKSHNIEYAVKIKDKVRAGATILARYKNES